MFYIEIMGAALLEIREGSREVNTHTPVRGVIGRRREVGGKSILLVTNRPDTPSRIEEHRTFARALMRRTGVDRVHVADTMVLDHKSKERLANPDKTLDQHLAVFVAGSPVVFLSERNEDSERGDRAQQFLTWGMPTISEALRRGIPYTGVCLGDQAMAAAVEGEGIVQRSLDNSEVQTAQVVFDRNALRGTHLLDGMNNQVDAAVVHDDSVMWAPRGFRVVAQTERDPRSGLYDPDRDALGLQFHPELVLSPSLRRKMEAAGYQQTGPLTPVTTGLTRLITNRAREAVVKAEMARAGFL